MWDIVLYAAGRRRGSAGALPTAITATPASGQITNSSLVDDVAANLSINGVASGTWAVSGFGGVKLISQTPTTAQLAVSQAITNADTGVYDVTVTYTFGSPAVVLTTVFSLTVNTPTSLTDLLPYGGNWYGEGFMSVHIWPETIGKQLGVGIRQNSVYVQRCPASELLCGVRTLIISAQSRTEVYGEVIVNADGSTTNGNWKSYGTGDFLIDVDFRSGAAAGSLSIGSKPNAKLIPTRQLTHYLGNPALAYPNNMFGGDTRRYHQLDFFVKPRGTAAGVQTNVGGAAISCTLESGSSTTAGHYVDAIIRFSSGAAKGLERRITASTTGRVVTFDTPIPAGTLPVAGDKYSIGIKVTKGQLYHLCHTPHDPPAAGVPVAQYPFVSLNVPTDYSNGPTWINRTPKGLSPPRQCGLGYGDDAFGLLYMTGGTYGVTSGASAEVWTQRPNVFGHFVWDFDVLDFGQLKYSLQQFTQGKDATAWTWKQCTIGTSAQHKLRQRWRYPLSLPNFKFRYFWIPLYYVHGARPNQPLTFKLFKEGVSETTLATVNVSPAAAAAVWPITAFDSDVTTGNEFALPNTNVNMGVDWVRIDCGVDGITLTGGDVFRIELASTATSFWYAWSQPNTNLQLANSDNRVAGSYALNNDLGYMQAWREDPSTPGKPAAVEKQVGASGSWNYLVYNQGNPQDADMTTLVGLFQKFT